MGLDVLNVDNVNMAPGIAHEELVVCEEESLNIGVEWNLPETMESETGAIGRVDTESFVQTFKFSWGDTCGDEDGIGVCEAHAQHVRTVVVEHSVHFRLLEVPQSHHPVL